MFTTGWAAPRRRSACRTADVLALKSHNLDATIFWFRAPNFGDPAQRHRRFCASSSLTEGTRALDVAAVGVQGRGSTTSFILCSSSHDCLKTLRSNFNSAKASRVYWPCFSAFLLPGGAPEPGAPPCIRQRLFPRTAGDLQGLPERVLAPQRGLDNIGPVLRR